MTAAPKQRMTLAEYEALLEASTERYEYVNGEAYAMAGGSLRHSVIIANVIRALGNRLDARPCVVGPPDTIVLVKETGLVTLPDVTVLCGPPERVDAPKHAITNPTVLVEVLSPSTQDWDRAGKFEHYKRIPSLREFVVVDAATSHVEVRRRVGENQWLMIDYIGNDATARLESLDLDLPLAEVYAKLELIDEPKAS